ncbi:methionine--tRNA ligase [Tepidicaulis sp. LMO-SS28]|uniref:methionine--tRNA ligase n=1 Tax=Tepidicaulis sp. LMO-SS28 TaxID=3447455 RepID=UPI003EE0DB85
MTAPKAFYITTAISYPNGPPHIGHAYELITTDILARFKRLDGQDVYFLTGVDDHGQKMVQTAKERGVTPQELADENAPKFKAMGAVYNITNDDFIRTSEPRHVLSAQTLWEKLIAKGDIYLDKYAGWYSVRDEAYYDEDELSDGEDGKKYAPTGTPVEWIEEESYFFRLSAYGDRLLEHYEANPDFILPETRRNEVVAFVKRGLRDLSISRTKIDWGVPVPGDPKHVMYVWLDALTNYITGIGYPNVEAESFKRFWPADVHIIGKDIVRFHAIIWPAMLMAAELPLPGRVFGHGFLFNRGEKMSKSVGNVVDPFDLAKAYGSDQIRYFFSREVPYGQDGSYSHETVVNRINADLANDLGNLAQRSLSMIAKNLEGKVPEPGALTAEDKAILDQAAGVLAQARTHMDRQQIHLMLAAVWDTVAEANRYFAAQEPWALKKTDPARMATVLYVTAEVIRQVAILAQPVVPQGAAKLLDLLCIVPEERDFASLGKALKPGTELPKPEGVFPRYVDEEKTA